MNTNSFPNPQAETVQPSEPSKKEPFDFDGWAVQVKRQMIEALTRRGLR